MTTLEVKEFVTNQILQSLDGSKGLENNKFDFKRSWYKEMTEDEGQFRFLVDLTAIVNSYGGGDGFLVIGYDEKKKEFEASGFEKTGLKDPSELIGIIRRKIDRPFNIQLVPHEFTDSSGVSHPISIVHIPPSLDKPHVIRNLILDGKNVYPNEIFVRIGDTNQRASKADLDLMYAEKANIIVERKAIIGIRLPGSHFSHEKFYDGHKMTTDENIFYNCELSIENLGFRPLAINYLKLQIDLIGLTGISSLNLNSRMNDGRYGDKTLILPNSIEIVYTSFGQKIASFSNEDARSAANTLNEFKENEKKLMFRKLTMSLSNGEEFVPELRLVHQ